MHFSILTTAFLLFSSSTLAFPSLSTSPDLEIRQQAPILTVTCPDYSRLANYTTIALNSTLRSAFLRSSPQGTDPSSSILDVAAKEYTSKNLIFDRDLNTQCGNLSTVAATEAGNNLTMGVVAGFKIVPAIGAEIGAGREVWCIVVILLLFAGFSFSL